MAKKYYAVKKGKQIGIFDTWSECQKAVSGYSGAIYKSFYSLEDAKKFMGEAQSTKQVSFEELKIPKIYVDGSYDSESERYSYGYVIVPPEGKKIKRKGIGTDNQFVSQRNVAGELLGTEKAINEAIELGYAKIIIFHDYEGIARWADGSWRANSGAALNYVSFLRSKREKIDISFIKVKGHSGDPLNELADRLAKSAFNDNPVKEGESWLRVEDYSLEDFETILKIIQEEVFADLQYEPPTKQGSCLIFRLKTLEERLTCCFYETSELLMIQGNKGNLFSVLKSYVLELANDEQIHKVYREMYNVHVDKQAVTNEYAAFLGDYDSKKLRISKKMERALRQSILNLHMDGDMYDYTQQVFPALRALEGFLRCILKKHQIPCQGNFDQFLLKNNANGRAKKTYEIRLKYHSNLGSPNKIKYINKTYNYLHKNRNSLFHWDDPGENVEFDDTRMVEEGQWKGIIRDVLGHINEYYVIQ